MSDPTPEDDDLDEYARANNMRWCDEHRNYYTKHGADECPKCVENKKRVRAAAASALRRAAEHEYGEPGNHHVDIHWKAWLRAEADRAERGE